MNFSAGNYRRVAELLEVQRPKGNEKDLRGWEWGFYWRLMHQDRRTFRRSGKGLVFSFAISPDRRMLASAYGDGSIRLWDLDTLNEILPSLSGPTGTAVLSLTFSPTNAGLLASGGDDKTIRLWDVGSRHVRTIHCTGEIRSEAFSQDGKYLATGCNDGTLMVMEAASNRQVYQKRFLSRNEVGIVGATPVYALTFSRDGRWLAVGCSDGNTKTSVVALRTCCRFFCLSV